MLFTRHAKNALVVLFIAVVWLPLVVMLVTPQRQISELENRRLASLPEFNIEKPLEFTGNFENYFNDHFGFREHLIRLFRILEVQVFHVLQTGQVIFGKDGWLFEAGHRQIADIRNNWPFNQAQLEEWAHVLSVKHERLEKEGIVYLFLFAPNKHLVYPEKLPASVNRVRELSRVDQLVDYLDKHTVVPFLDLRQPLFEAKKQLRPYHRTDTHWNAWGAYVGYSTVAEYLQKYFPELQAVELNADDFGRRKKPGRNLARTLSMQEQLTEIEIYPEKWQPTCAVYEGLPKNFTRLDQNSNPFITLCKKGHKRLLMFRDSYSLDMMPYLSETFAYIHYYHKSPVPLKGMLNVIKQHNPDIVIEERSTRWLRKPYG